MLLILPSDTEMRMERPTVGKVKEGSVPGPVAGAPPERPTCPTSNEGGRQRREEKTSVPSPPLEALRERETGRPRRPDTREGGGVSSCSDLGRDGDTGLKSLGRGPCPKSGYDENCS